MPLRPVYLAFAILIATTPVSHADEVTEDIKVYLENFAGEPGFEPLVSGLKFEYDRLQHFMKTEAQFEWAVSVAIEPSGRYAVGFGKDHSTGRGPTRHSNRFCKQQRKIRSMKAKCRVFAINSEIRKPYKR